MRQGAGGVSGQLMMNCPGNSSRDSPAICRHRADQGDDPSKRHPGSTEAGGGGGATLRLGRSHLLGVSLGHFRSRRERSPAGPWGEDCNEGHCHPSHKVLV